jgi:hypothetical protein
MAVTSRDIQVERRMPGLYYARSAGWLAYLVTLILAMLAIYVLVGGAIDWMQVRIDDVRYGRPRTSHLEGYVGHGAERVDQPTRFIGLNLDRQVIILEFPGGDTSQVRSLQGPYLFGADEDLVPVLLSLEDVDRDGFSDLLVTVRNEQLVYLNRDGSFRLPTADEQMQLLQERGP